MSVFGKADALQLSMTGTGNFQGEDLKATRATVQHLGVGKVVVNASKQLDASIIGYGVVEYVGSPTVRKSVLGLGAVTKKK